MKTLVSFLALVGLTAQINLANADAVQHKDVAIGVSNVFVPGGFGPDTDAYVIGSGMYPNSCYKWDRSEVTNVTPLVHEIRTYASVAQSICLMVLVPYSQEIQLGRMVSGTHTLRFLAGDGTAFERPMVIE